MLRKRVREEWPDSVREIAGSWQDAPRAEELREDIGADYTGNDL
jgi:hypothetical protein